MCTEVPGWSTATTSTIFCMSKCMPNQVVTKPNACLLLYVLCLTIFPVRPESEPSSDQISAMKVRVLELGLSPYADFGIFVNFQHCFSKTLKFLNHILQPDGTFKAVEVPGPPHYDQWLSSWKVFENTLLMFEVTDGDSKRPVVKSCGTSRWFYGNSRRMNNKSVSSYVNKYIYIYIVQFVFIVGVGGYSFDGH